MGGLIPLLLPSATARQTTPVQSAEVRRPVSLTTPHVSTSLGHRRQQSLPMGKSVARLSISTQASTSTVPTTPEDWRKTINDVKLKYIGRKYRTCSARCSEVLDNLKDTSNVETLHLVYLHFYAASSSEMCARPLSRSSAYRTKLLDDARENYDKASTLIKKAEEIAVERSRSGSSLSTAPSLTSSSPSVSPRSSSICTAPSTPRDSMSSDDFNVEAKPKKKKKVSFSSLPEIEIPKYESRSEPYIRPDSPTLGWEADGVVFGHGATASEAVIYKPMAINIPKPVEPQSMPSPILKSVPEESQNEDIFDLESFLQSRSVNRIISQLSALRSQVAWHRDNIDALLTESEEAPEIPDTPSLPEASPVPGLTHSDGSSSSTSEADELASPPLSAALTPHTLENTLSQQFKNSFGSNSSFDLTSARLSMFGDAWERTRSGSVCSSTSSCAPSGPPRAASQMSMLSNGDESLQKRIEKLRANGWQRKRFDSRRYEALREQVLSELGP
ncbi:hypothetical protein LQW54_007239 [Pestalotiopsis sp. IQ-011]